MSDRVTSFIRCRHIDSFQKLCFLLLLNEHSKLTGTIHEFAERFYFGDARLLEEILNDLQMAGLVDCVEKNHYRLHDDPGVSSCLQYLAKAFEDPLARQEILDQVKHNVSFSRYKGNAHELH